MDAKELRKLLEDIKGLGDDAKKQILYDKKFLEKSKFSDHELKWIILSMSDEIKTELLSDKELMTDILHMSNWNISEIIKSLSDENEKIKLLEEYNIESVLVIDIVSSFSLKKRIDIILNDEKLNKFNIIKLMRIFDSDELIAFMIENKDFLDKKKICLYEVIADLDNEKQKEIALKLKDINLSINEKMEILAIISEEVKQNLDTQEFPEELRKAISIKSRKYMAQIDIEFDRDMEDYRGLDRLIKVNPTNYTEEEKIKFRKLCGVCPALQVINLLNNTVPFFSTAQEYLEAEEWVDSVISGIDPAYSKAQKMAIIDNTIGKKISYSPDFDTEVFNSQNARALWKMVSLGYGVCNGIANLEQYMLRRVGIESDVVESRNHAFLKIKDIELPLANGETVRGNTIIDPTWNLTANRYGGKPSHFCINYEQARQSDVDEEGRDHKCHKNDEKLKDATLSLDDQSLRNLYTSVGLADEKG